MKKNNFKSLMQAAVLVCTPLVIASCDDVFGDVDNPVSSHISIKDAAVNLVLHADSAAKATYTRTAIAASGAQIEYSSSDEKIATVDAKTGKITAVNGGECEIIAKATGLDSRGNKTYQEEEVRFPVKVTDYRCRVEFEEAAATVNSADIDAQVFKLKSSEVYPKGCPVTISHVAKVAADGDPVAFINNTTGAITLAKKNGVSVITVKIDDTDPSFNNKYEVKSNAVDDPDNPGSKAVMATFTLTVKEGVAYLEGYDATGKEIRKTMLKGTGADEYINLSDKLKPAGSWATTDVTLDAGWYLVDQPLGGFTNNIRVKGDVNIILNGNNFNIGTGNVMDESAKQNYKLNFFPQKFAAATPASGAATFGNIKEFKEVNILGVNVSAPLNAVENVNIINGSVNMAIGTGTGAVEITNGTSGQLSKFSTVTINKGTSASWVWSMDHIGTATISEGATVASTISDVENLSIEKAASIADLTAIKNLTINKTTAIGDLTNIGTAVVTETPTNVLQDITNLTLNKVDATATTQLLRIGTVTINKLVGTAKFTSGIKANALNISDGTIEVGATATRAQIVGFKKITGGWEDQDTKVTMTGGDLKVYGLTGTKFAVLGDVQVSGGKFYAESPDHHAVSGALVGTFEGSTDGTTWTAITGAERPKYIQNKK